MYAFLEQNHFIYDVSVSSPNGKITAASLDIKGDVTFSGLGAKSAVKMVNVCLQLSYFYVRKCKV